MKRCIFGKEGARGILLLPMRSPALRDAKSGQENMLRKLRT